MSFEDIIFLAVKTLICYFFLIITLKIMGKREIGKVSTFDIVVFFVISELFSLSLNDPKGNLLHSIIPILVIVILQLVTAKISIKNVKFRKYMEGEPTFIIFNGKIDFKSMKKNRYNTDDLLLQLRTKNIVSLKDVKFALLEQTGTLNVIKYQDCDFIDPFPFIQDGNVDYNVLKRNNMNLEDLYKYIFQEGYTTIEEIFLMFMKPNSAVIIPYEESYKVEDI